MSVLRRRRFTLQERTILGWDELRLVLAIGRAGTLSGGARQLGIDHSTAFRRLGALEARLGVRFFDRARDGYAATPVGEAAISEAARFDEAVAGLERRLAGENLRPSGVVRATTTDTLIDILAPLLAAFRREYPEITVELVVSNEFFSLTRRDADVAIRPAAQAPENLVGRRLGEVATAIYAARDYARQQPRKLELEGHEWVGLDESLGHLGSARWLQSHIPEDRIVGRASSLFALRALAREGMGVAALPCYLGDADERLVRVHAPLPEMSAGLWLLTHPDLRRVARIRAFLDTMARQLARLRPTFEGKRRPA
jgi:DNA-binding transcriptional LysR family regulator